MVTGGLPIMEILMRNEHAMNNLKNVIKEVPEIIAGAGTILTVDQAREAIDIGAKFIVLPGFSEKIVNLCAKSDIMVIPGCVTATELMAANEYNLEIIKFFPVCSMGLAHALDEVFLYFKQAHQFSHGMRVGFATIPMLAYAGKGTRIINDYIDFCRSIGIPTTLTELGLEQITIKEWNEAASATIIAKDTLNGLPYKVSFKELLTYVLRFR